MSCLIHDVWILEYNCVCMHSYMYLKCIVIQVVEQVLGHEISRFLVKSFRRVMEVKEEVTGKRKGGKQHDKKRNRSWFSGAVAGRLSSIRLQQEEGSHEEDSSSLSSYLHS